jgi:hypothetical protein
MKYTNGEDFARLSFLQSLEKESFPLRPDKAGFADTARAENPFSGKAFEGFEALFLKAAARERGLKTAEFLSISEAETVRKSARGGKGRIIESSARLTVVSFREERKEGGLSFRTKRFVNISETSFPEKIREQGLHFRERQKQGAGERFQARSLCCVSTDPAAVLGLYFAALQTGRPFKISLGQYQEWSKKTRNVLSRESLSLSPDKEKKVTGPSTFVKFAAVAIKACAEVVVALGGPAPALGLGLAKAAGLGIAAAARKAADFPSRER